MNWTETYIFILLSVCLTEILCEELLLLGCTIFLLKGFEFYVLPHFIQPFFKAYWWMHQTLPSTKIKSSNCLINRVELHDCKQNLLTIHWMHNTLNVSLTRISQKQCKNCIIVTWTINTIICLSSSLHCIGICVRQQYNNTTQVCLRFWTWLYAFW